MKMDLVTFDEALLKLTWKWLNDPEIKILINIATFSKSDQIKWFNSLLMRIDYQIWGIAVDQIRVGVCGLKNITETDCEYWGYIGEKKYWGKGIGAFMLKTLIEYAKNLDLNSVWLTVIENNNRAIRLYAKHGFELESEDENKLIKMRLKL